MLAHALRQQGIPLSAGDRGYPTDGQATLDLNALVRGEKLDDCSGDSSRHAWSLPIFAVLQFAAAVQGTRRLASGQQRTPSTARTTTEQVIHPAEVLRPRSPAKRSSDAGPTRRSWQQGSSALKRTRSVSSSSVSISGRRERIGNQQGCRCGWLGRRSSSLVYPPGGRARGGLVDHVGHRGRRRGSLSSGRKDDRAPTGPACDGRSVAGASVLILRGLPSEASSCREESSSIAFARAVQVSDPRRPMLRPSPVY